MYGWREGRSPNLYFQPDWYSAENPAAGADGANPLLHYIREGERSGRRPSPWFDPVWYRNRYQIAENDSPLRHYLMHRSGALFSPLPESEAAELLEPDEEDVVSEAETQEQEPAVEDEFPMFADVVAILGVDPQASDDPLTVAPDDLRQVLRLFLNTARFDEEGYLREYPDVADAVTDSRLTSGREHFIEFGYFEGRNPLPGILSSE